jgi:hypothetical protein
MADVRTAVVTFNTSGVFSSTKDITSPKFGRPKAAIFVLTGADGGAIPGTEAPNSIIGIGFADGTNRRIMTTFADDAVATSDTSIIANDAAVLTALDEFGSAGLSICR